MKQLFHPGQIVYIIIRNPHAQDVAAIQEAAVVQATETAGELSLFIHETYYPLTDEVAVYHTFEEAEAVFKDTFGLSEMENYDG